MTDFPSAPARWTFRTIATPARFYALSRIALGAWIFLDPSGFGAKWLAPPQDPLLTGLMLRAGGGKDVLLGFGLLLADRPRRWLWICARASCSSRAAGSPIRTCGPGSSAREASGSSRW